MMQVFLDNKLQKDYLPKTSTKADFKFRGGRKNKTRKSKRKRKNQT